MSDNIIRRWHSTKLMMLCTMVVVRFGVLLVLSLLYIVVVLWRGTLRNRFSNCNELGLRLSWHVVRGVGGMLSRGGSHSLDGLRLNQVSQSFGIEDEEAMSFVLRLLRFLVPSDDSAMKGPMCTTTDSGANMHTSSGLCTLQSMLV